MSNRDQSPGGSLLYLKWGHLAWSGCRISRILAQAFLLALVATIVTAPDVLANLPWPFYESLSAVLDLAPAGFFFALCSYVFFLLAHEALQRRVAHAIRAPLLNQEFHLPLVLYLRSFDAGESPALRRISRFLPLKRLGSWRTWLLPGGEYWVYNTDSYLFEIEEELRSALGPHGILVAIGNKKVSYGALKLLEDDATWQATFHQLTRAAAAIVIVPGRSKALTWEISQILGTTLAAKSFFIRPHNCEPQWWHDSQYTCATTFACELPPYRKAGCAFRMSRLGGGVARLDRFFIALRSALRDGRKEIEGIDLDRLWFMARL